MPRLHPRHPLVSQARSLGAALFLAPLLWMAACSDARTPTEAPLAADAASPLADFRMCADGPCQPAPAFATDFCPVVRVELKAVDAPFSASPVTLVQGQQQRLSMRAYSTTSGLSGSIPVDDCTVTVTSSNNGVATVTTENAGYETFITVRTVGPGQATITAKVESEQSNAIKSGTFAYTVTPAPTATPVVGPITGNQTVSQSGTYNYRVTASGGNGTYTYTWEAKHGNLNWQTVHTASGGPASTAPIIIVGGRLYSIRVKVASGNSTVATSAEYTVDARGAAAPLGVALSGYDNIRERGVHEWEAVATGGNGTYTYSWRMERPGEPDLTGYTGQVFSWWFDSCDEEPDGSLVEVTVTSGSETATAWMSLNVETYLRSPCD